MTMSNDALNAGDQIERRADARMWTPPPPQAGTIDAVLDALERLSNVARDDLADVPDFKS